MKGFEMILFLSGKERERERERAWNVVILIKTGSLKLSKSVPQNYAKIAGHSRHSQMLGTVINFSE
jgi:hypothetical protein